jgi:hypothetical protein
MRLTINLDDDLYAMARSHAIATRTSLSKAVGDLLRRKVAAGVAAPPPDGNTTSYFDPVLGIQVSRSGRPISQEDVKQALADEDSPALQLAGPSVKPGARR